MIKKIWGKLKLRSSKLGFVKNLSTRLGKIQWRSLFRFSTIETFLEKTVSVLLKLGTLFLVTILLVFFFRLFTDQGYVIQPFSMPKDLTEQGLNGQVFAVRVQEALEGLKEEAGSVKEDSLQLKEGGQDLDLSVLGVGLSLHGLAFQLREILGRENKTLRGEVVHLDDKFSAQIRMTGYDLITKEIVIEDSREGAALDQLIRELAKGLLYETDPYRLALVLRKEGKEEEAVDAIRHILRTRPAEAHWAYLAWGNMLKGSGQYAASVKKYQSALEIKPDFELAWYNIAYAYQELEQTESAIAAMEKCLNAKTSNNWRWSSYLWMLHNAEYYEKVDSLSPIVLNNLDLDKEQRVMMATSWAEMKLQRGELLEAREVINTFFTDYGENVMSYLVKGVVAIMSTDTLEGLGMLKQALEIDPSHSGAVNVNANLPYSVGAYRQSADVYYIADWENVWEGNKPNAFNRIAMAMNQLSQYDSAMMIIHQAIEMDPFANYLYTTKAETFAFKGQLDSCFHYFEYALERGFKYENLDLDVEPTLSLISHPEMQRLTRKYKKEEIELSSTTEVDL